MGINTEEEAEGEVVEEMEEEAENGRVLEKTEIVPLESFARKCVVSVRTKQRRLIIGTWNQFKNF